jgi:hypothetical protein
MIKTFEQNKVLDIYFFILSFFLIIFGLFLQPLNEIIPGLVAIISAQGILITDYFEIGGPGAAWVNAGLSLLLTVMYAHFSKLKFSGLTFAAMFTYLGFTFFGKNFVNVIPIFIGVRLYAFYVKEPIKNYVHIAIFATCLAPIVSTNFTNNSSGIMLSSLIGVVYGFLIVPLGAQAMRWHNGYTLYNIGFSGGVFALITAAVVRTIGFELLPASYISHQYHNQILLISLLISISFFIISLANKNLDLKDYITLCKRPGRAVTDYFVLHKPTEVYFNIAIISLIATLVALLTQVPLNGPIFGGICTMIGFAAFGKSPLNTIPVMIGVVLMFILSPHTITTATVLTILFCTCLAPISGQYGILIGVLAGALHYSVVGFTASWQGAFNLYNNGFASGLVAGFLINILDSIKKVD